MKRTQRTLPLVMVEWVDSYGCSSRWRELEELTPDPMICRSVGWLLHRDRECIVLVAYLIEPDRDEGPRSQGMGDMTTPSCAVKAMHALSPVVSVSCNGYGRSASCVRGSPRWKPRVPCPSSTSSGRSMYVPHRTLLAETDACRGRDIAWLSWN
jgi:hypothetical protein